MRADAQNGYTWGWRLYIGKEEDSVQTGLAHGVVLDLVDNARLQGKGYVVVTDNFYSSPALFCDLVARGFGPCGTGQKDCKGVPLSVRNAALRRGAVASSVDDSILSLKWKDKRDVQS